MARVGLDLIVGDGGTGHIQRADAPRVDHALRALGPLKVDEMMHQLGQARGFLGDAAGEVPHGVRIVGRVGHGFGEQRDRAGRGLEFMRDVGHEVAADGLETTLFGHVVDEDGIQVVADVADAHTQVHRVGRARLTGLKAAAVRGWIGAVVDRQLDLALTHTAIGGDLGENVLDLTRVEPAPGHQGERHRTGACVLDQTIAIGDDQGFGQRFDQTPLGGAHGHIDAEQGTRVLIAGQVLFGGKATRNTALVVGDDGDPCQRQHGEHHGHDDLRDIHDSQSKTPEA